MSNIQITQPGGVGTLASDGNIQVGVRCYLAATGVTARSWLILSAPAGSTTIARLGKQGWYFDPDTKSETAYVVQLTDSNLNTYTNSFYASGRPSAPGYPAPTDPIYAEWFGVKANGREVSDGIVSGGSPILTSATAAFTLADEGRAGLMRTPSSLAGGTLSTTSGSINVTGTGTAYLTDIPKIVGDPAATYQPASGGAIYVVGMGYCVAQYANAGTQAITLYANAAATVTNAAWYTETQLEFTIVKYISPTQVQISVAPTFSEAGVTVYWGSDDTTAIDDAIRFCFTNGIHSIRLPGGNLSMSANLVYTSQSGLTIAGPVATRCTIHDLRRASRETAYPNAAISYGILSFNLCDGIVLQDFGYTARLPVIGVVHSAGGSVNNSGSRSGPFMRSCTNSAFIRMRSEGYGARDEHLYVDGDSRNFLFDSCVVVGNNNVSLNVNGGFDGGGNPYPTGVRITKCVASGILAGCGTLLIDHCDITTNADARLPGGMTLSPIGHAIIDSNIFHDFNLLSAGTSALDVFGTASANSSLTISNNKFVRLSGLWDAGHGAVIKILSGGGTSVIVGNDVDRCTSSAAGRFVSIEGAATDKVFLGANRLRGRAGCNMTIGYYIDAAVPASAVTIAAGTFFGESITTKWSLGVACETAVDLTYQLQQRTDPAAPGALQAKVYLKDNGGGKGQLVVRFPTGAVQVIATEP